MPQTPLSHWSVLPEEIQVATLSPEQGISRVKLPVLQRREMSLGRALG